MNNTPLKTRLEEILDDPHAIEHLASAIGDERDDLCELMDRVDRFVTEFAQQAIDRTRRVELKSILDLTMVGFVASHSRFAHIGVDFLFEPACSCLTLRIEINTSNQESGMFTKLRLHRDFEVKASE